MSAIFMSGFILNLTTKSLQIRSSLHESVAPATAYRLDELRDYYRITEIQWAKSTNGWGHK